MSKHQETLERVKRIYDQVDEMDLPDGAHWQMVNDMLGWGPGDAEHFMTENPKFFGLIPLTRKED